MDIRLGLGRLVEQHQQDVAVRRYNEMEMISPSYITKLCRVWSMAIPRYCCFRAFIEHGKIITARIRFFENWDDPRAKPA